MTATTTYDLSTITHEQAHQLLHRHIADPDVPNPAQRNAIKDALFECHYVRPCGWQPSADDLARRERIDQQWLDALEPDERRRVLAVRAKFDALGAALHGASRL